MDSIQPTRHRRQPLRRRLIGVAGAFGLVATMAAVASPAFADDPVVVLTADFEDGTTQDWFGRGAAQVEVSSDEANSGDASLLTTDRGDNWHGPARNLLGVISPGGTYEFEAFVRLADADAAADVHMTLQNTPDGGETAYTRLGSASAAGDGWTQVTGEIALPTGGFSELELYLESDDTEVSFYLDDVTVTQTVAPPPPGEGEVLIHNDFEDGTTQGWGPRDEESVVATEADAYEGDWSLLISDRTETWNGPARDLTAYLEPANTYQLSLYLKLAPGQDSTQLRVSVQQDTDGESTYTTLIPNATVGPNAWVHFSGSWTPTSQADAVILYAESADALVDFYLDEFTLSVAGTPDVQEDIPSLHEVLADNFEAVGSAIDARETVGAQAQLLTKHFNSVTAENQMKPETIQPVEGQFNFGPGDELLEFAEANGMRMYGHTLVWHSQTPDWFFEDADGNPLTDSPEHQQIALDRMEAHINAIADHYGDRLWAWDVVNEVIDDSQDDNLRRSRWYEILGPDFVAHAFHFARDAFGPDVKLFINDYNTEFPAKRQAMYTVVEGLLADGVPVDGVGHQLHLNLSRPISWVSDSLELFSQLPVDQAVTELDVSISTSSSESLPSPPPDRVVRQGYYYRDLFEVLREYDDVLTSVTVWGLYDTRSWLRTWPIDRPHEAPLLFDDQLQAKPAYWGIVDPATLPHLPMSTNAPAGTVEVDGERELQWQLLPLTVVRGSAGTDATHGDGSEDGVIGFQVRWDDENLYVLADVADPTVDAGDRVELFTDAGPVAIARDGSVTGDATAAAVETEAGYRVEAAIPLAGLAEGDTVAFDFRTTDGATGEQVSWSDLSHEQETTSERWGSVTLLEAVRYVDIPYAETAPTVNGEIDATWDDAATVRTEVLVEGSADGAQADVSLLWDEERLYVLAQVDDPSLDNANSNPWEQDSIEIFVDPENAKNGPFLEHDGQYRISYTNFLSFGGDPAVVEEKLNSATSVVDGGYIVEASIELDSIEAEVGTFLGLEFQINDATAGTRTSVHTWHDPTGQSYQDTSRWGVGRLVEAEGGEDPGEPGITCDRTISGTHFGSLSAKGETVCLEPGASVYGPVNVRDGGSFVATDATVLGPVSLQKADVVRVIDSRITGPLSINHGTGEVTLSGNKVLGPVSVVQNRTGDTPVVVSGNSVTGPVNCTGNEPAPVNNGVPNSVLGPAVGQCKGL